MLTRSSKEWADDVDKLIIHFIEIKWIRDRRDYDDFDMTLNNAEPKSRM